MSEMVVLHCGKNNFTTRPMPLREAVAYIAEAVEDGMDCVGTHEVRAYDWIADPVSANLRVDPESAIDWLRSRLQYVPGFDQPNGLDDWDW